MMMKLNTLLLLCVLCACLSGVRCVYQYNSYFLDSACSSSLRISSTYSSSAQRTCPVGVPVTCTLNTTTGIYVLAQCLQQLPSNALRAINTFVTAQYTSDCSNITYVNSMSTLCIGPYTVAGTQYWQQTQCSGASATTSVYTTACSGAANSSTTIQAPTNPTCSANSASIYACNALVTNGISLGSLPTSGGVLTISGVAFGSNSSQVNVTVGPYACTGVSIITPNYQLTCSIGAGVGANLKTVVYVNRVANPQNYTFSFQAPTISSVSVACRAGGVITISGSNFGSNPNAIFVNLPYNLTCTNIAIVNASTSFTCLLSSATAVIANEGITDGIPLIVTVGNQSTNSSADGLGFYPQLTVQFTPTNPKCPNSDISIQYTVNGGLPPYSAWGERLGNVSAAPVGRCYNPPTNVNDTVLFFQAKSSSMTVQYCLFLCETQAAAIFAALTGGDTCYCGSGGWTFYPIAYDNNCTIPCTGNRSQSCGGPNSKFTIWRAAGVEVLSSPSPGSYPFNLYVADQCETIIVPATANVPAPFVITPTITNSPCYGDKNASISVVAKGGTGNLTFTWNGVSSIGNKLSNLGPGSYFLTATDAVGCVSDPVNITITEPSPLAFASINVTNTTTRTSIDGSISVDVIGGTPPYSYLWSNSSLQTSSLQYLRPSTQTLTVTDSQKCFIQTQISVYATVPITMAPITQAPTAAPTVTNPVTSAPTSAAPSTAAPTSGPVNGTASLSSTGGSTGARSSAIPSVVTSGFPYFTTTADINGAGRALDGLVAVVILAAFGGAVLV